MEDDFIDMEDRFIDMEDRFIFMGYDINTLRGRFSTSFTRPFVKSWYLADSAAHL
jgi:hypothetical protein